METLQRSVDNLTQALAVISAFLDQTDPVSPYPQNLGGEISPLNFGGGVSGTPCFAVFSEGRPLNLGGEIVTP